MSLQPGVYQAIVTQHYWTTSQSGNPGLAVVVTIKDDWGATDMTGVIWFTPKSIGMARAQLRALGFDPDHRHCRDIGLAVDLTGTAVEVYLEEEEYKERKTLRIKRFGSGAKPPTFEQLDELDSHLAAAKKRSETPLPPPESAPEPEPAPATAPPSPPEGDDIPF